MEDGPDSGLGFEANVLKKPQVFPSSLCDVPCVVHTECRIENDGP